MHVYAQDRLRQTAPVASKPTPAAAEDVSPVVQARLEREAKLRVLWEVRPKLSGGEIAKRLGFGFRGSVYAMAKRLELPDRRGDEDLLPEDVRDRIIIDAWPDRSVSTTTIAARCGWKNAQSVTARARQLDLPLRQRGKVKP